MKGCSASALLGAVAMLLLLAAPATAANREAELRAAFVANFARFTAWPVSEPEPKRFVIGVLSDDDMADSIEKAFRGKSVEDRQVEVLRLSDLSAIDELQILYVGKIEEQNLAALFHALKGKPILTVSHVDGFAESGGAIGLITQGRKIRFEINRATVEKAGMTISSKVLRLASHLYDEN